MKKAAGLVVALALLGLPATASAQAIDGAVSAPAGATAIPLYGKANPGSPADEAETRFMGRETVLRNITYPTLTPVLPAPGKANGTAVIVAPGGGFTMLAMQNEGWRVAQALADRGVTAFVLKYRLNPTDRDDKAWMAGMMKMFASLGQGGGRPPEIKDPAATEDALAALKLVRGRAGEWGVDAHRVGMIGFSAGAMTTLNAILQGSDGQAGPDFAGYIYGPMAAVAVPANAPPMFAALAMDDPLFGGGEFGIVSAWHAARKPVELHVYQAGSHGFGLGKPGTTSTLMMPEFLLWMESQGLLTAKAKP
ncbi:MAG: alpha/beta hydrolase [Sphingomonadales bacterium]|nr:alpha/beta hydrolase [Sphingomonadales bacterium]